MNTILVTDSLFVGKGHVDGLARSGFTVDRLDVTKASEDELCDRIKGKVGYILGGVELVTKRVIDAADALRAISFTGSGYSEYIPAHEEATRRGIAITAAVAGNAEAVAEYTLALILSLARKLPLLTNPGSGVKGLTVPGFKNLTVGIVGYGHIGRQVARMATLLGFNVVATSSRRRFPSVAHVRLLSLEEVLRTADIVSIHVDKSRGETIIGGKELSMIRDGGAVVNAAFPQAVDVPALMSELRKKRLIAAFDAGVDGVAELPPGYFTQSNSQTGFNTEEANEKVSDMVVTSILNILTTGYDAYLVNPRYREKVPT